MLSNIPWEWANGKLFEDIRNPLPNICHLKKMRISLTNLLVGCQYPLTPFNKYDRGWPILYSPMPFKKFASELPIPRDTLKQICRRFTSNLWNIWKRVAALHTRFLQNLWMTQNSNFQTKNQLTAIKSIRAYLSSQLYSVHLFHP
jgi:hypothetical protein